MSCHVNMPNKHENSQTPMYMKLKCKVNSFLSFLTNDGSYLRHSPLNYRASIHCRNSYLITNAYTSPFETPLQDPSKNALAFEMAGIPVVAGEDLLPPGRLLSPFADVPATRVVAFSLFYLLGVSLPLRPFVSSPPCRNCRSAEEACLAPSTPVLPPSRGL